MSPAPPRARRPNYNPFAFDRVEVSPFIMCVSARASAFRRAPSARPHPLDPRDPAPRRTRARLLLLVSLLLLLPVGSSSRSAPPLPEPDRLRARRPHPLQPPFSRLRKLHALVSDPRSDDVVRWTPDGRSFVVRDAAAFERRLVGVLPAFPSRANMSAFAREVRNYGFVLAAPAADGGETCDASEFWRTSTAVEGFDGVAFAADGFRKDEPERLAEVRPKENFGRFRRDAKSDAT